MAFGVKIHNLPSSKHLKFIGILLLSAIIMSILACLYMQNLQSYVKQQTNLSLTQLAEENTELLKIQANDELKMLSSLAAVLEKAQNVNPVTAVTILNAQSGVDSSDYLFLVDSDGTTYTADGDIINFSKEEFFTKTMTGEATIASTLMGGLDHQLMIVYAVPVRQNNEIIGVLAAAYKATDYAALLQTATFRGKEYSYIIDQNGTIVIPSDLDASQNIQNIFEDSFQNEKAISQLKSDMNAQRSGILTQKINGINSFIVYAPAGIKDWYSCSVIPDSVVRLNASSLIASSLRACLIIIFLFLSILILIYYIMVKNRNMLEHLAYTDPITGLSNWNKFKMDSAKILKQQISKKYAYISISIDKFEIISEIYGIEKSNWILCVVAKELDAILQEHETFARQSGDCFVALMTYSDNLSSITDRLTALNQTVNTKIPDINVTLICGICEITDRTVAIDIISDRASLAQQAAQSGSNGNFAFYDEKLRGRMITEKQIENCMEEALTNHEFQLYLQPKYDLCSEQIAGAEALVRWTTGDGQILFPNHFIPVFEKNGFISRLDLYMFEAVCRTLRSMLDREMQVVPISINVSRLHLYDSNFVASFVAVFQKYNLPPSLIELEMTESIYTEDVKLLNSIIKRFHDIGFRLSMDDFGSGYSSLNILKDSHMDVIKIDKEFLSNMSDNPRNRYIIESIIRMCKKLGLVVVAEGVETTAQVKFLRALECDMAQGFYYAKPLSITSFESLLQQKNN